MLYLGFVIGVVVGSIVTIVASKLRSGYGILRIDHTDPEKDVYRFDLNKFDDLRKKKRIVMRIDNNADFRKNNTSYYEND